MFTNRISRWWSASQTNDIDPHVVSSESESHRSMAPMNLNKAESAHRANDFWIYRIVVTALGSTLVICTVGAISLEINGKPTPSLVSSLGTGSLAAIAGLLVPSPIKR